MTVTILDTSSARMVRHAAIALLCSTVLTGNAPAQNIPAATTVPQKADALPAAGGDGQALPDPRTAEEADDIIVTGTATAQRKFDVSYAVTSLSQDDIKQLAPLSFADLLSQVPGILAESTSGEVQNVYRLRGIPNEGGFQAFHQDGMPIYHDNDGVFFKGDVLNRLDLMTRNVEFVRGGPAPIFASNASAI